jgi:hypothetical protein
MASIGIQGQNVDQEPSLLQRLSQLEFRCLTKRRGEAEHQTLRPSSAVPSAFVAMAGYNQLACRLRRSDLT